MPNRPSRVARLPLSDRRRRARAFIVASGLLAAAALGLGSTHVHACSAKTDALAHGDALFSAVRPADCSTLLREVADFTWPAQGGRNTYSITLTFPDGHAETRSTDTNWLAWDAPLAPGEYRWTVKVAGDTNLTSAARLFTVEPESWVPLAVARRDPLQGRARTMVN